MRAFVALEPSIEVCERLVLLQEDLADPIHLLGGEIVWRRGDQLRVLLRSFETDPSQLGWIEGALAEALARLKPPSFVIHSTRFLPSEDRAQLLVADVVPDSDGLAVAIATINEVLASRGIAAPLSEWQPLLQIGRLRTTDLSPRLHGVARPFSETPYGSSTCHSAVLSTTTVSRGRLRARQVRRLPFDSDATSAATSR